MIMTDASNTPYALTPELIAAKEAVVAAKQKAAKLRQRVNETSNEAENLKMEVGRMTLYMASMYADRALADDNQAAIIDAGLKKLTTNLDAKTREWNRVVATTQALEAKAPEIDEDVSIAQNLLSLERGLWLGPVLETLQTELTEAVRPVVGILAKIKALRLCSPTLQDVASAAWVPDPLNFMLSTNGVYSYNNGRNLLDDAPNEQQRAEAEAILVAVLSVNQLISGHHEKYVPLEMRPKPYVRKGYTMQGAAEDAAPFKHDDAPTWATGNDSVRPAAKHSLDDLDGEMGHKLVNNLMRDTDSESSAQY